MLNDARGYLSQAPYMALLPGLAIFLAVLAFNLIGDGLRDALDPRVNYPDQTLMVLVKACRDRAMWTIPTPRLSLA